MGIELLSKGKKALVKHYTETIQILGEKNIERIIKQDYMHECTKNKKEIESYFKYFASEYIKCLKDLKITYKVKYIYDDYSKLDKRCYLNEELDTFEGLYEKYVDSIFMSSAIYRKINPKTFTNILDKWNILTKLIAPSNNILDFIKWYKTYNKDYDDTEIKQKYQDSQYLYRDFSIITKQLKR